MTAQVEILREVEEERGWIFDAQLLDDEGSLRRIVLRLGWADYNLWCRGGSDPPQRVAEAALHFLLHRLEPDRLPLNFDASLARRLFIDADEQIPEHIRG